MLRYNKSTGFTINNMPIEDFYCFYHGVGDSICPIALKIYGADLPIELIGETVFVTQEMCKELKINGKFN
jgi:hypothetical protein